MIMLRKLLSIANENFDQTLTGFAIIAIGTLLWIDRNYFSWPPEELRSMMNSELVDVFFMFLGVGILLCALTGNKNKALHHTLLILAGAAILMLAVTQWWHVRFAGEFRMAHSIISDCVTFVLILRCAYKS